VRIALLLVRHPPGRLGPIMPEVTRLLVERGAEVEIVHPEERVTDLRMLAAQHDLYVLKSGTEAGLSLAGALEAAGAAVLNPYGVAAACRDKVVGTKVLAAAGVPVPDTYVTAKPRELSPLLERGPLVLKPYRGSQGAGIRVVRTRKEVERLEEDGKPILVQRYLESRGCDRKLYRIGDEIFGVARVWPARSYEEKLGRPFAVGPELRELVLRCGEPFGITLYGVDVVVADRPYVVDMCSFPGFKGVPQAAERLAEYVYGAARRASAGRPMLAETAA
jgi:ribosomal protein S6--L-glutamate ligase